MSHPEVPSASPTRGKEHHAKAVLIPLQRDIVKGGSGTRNLAAQIGFLCFSVFLVLALVCFV